MNHTQIHEPASPASTPQSHLTQVELARRWNKSGGTLERFLSEGVGPRFPKIGGTVRYLRASGACLPFPLTVHANSPHGPPAAPCAPHPPVTGARRLLRMMRTGRFAGLSSRPKRRYGLGQLGAATSRTTASTAPETGLKSLKSGCRQPPPR